MKTLILLAFVLIASAFAGELQELMCGNKSLSYCINHFDRQCKTKSYSACFFVGGLYKEQEQYSQAKKYIEMVCDKANSKDSYELEWIDGGVKQVPIIESMKISCYELGGFYHDGLGVRQSYKKALLYFLKACDFGQGAGCGLAGKLYYNGRGIKKDLNHTLKLLTKSCELEYGFGCSMLGALYLLGEGVKQNPSKAKELLGKACDFGYQDGCYDYKELKEKGY